MGNSKSSDARQFSSTQKRYCTRCQVELVLSTNWAQKRAEHHAYICTPCKNAVDRKYYSANREHVISRVVRWQQMNPDLALKYRRRTEERIRFSPYWMSINDYHKAVEFQGGRCPICELLLSMDDKKTFQRPVLDHEHSSTGNIRVLRGVLHCSCDLIMTERICSRPEILLNAVSYRESDPTGLIYNPNGHGPNSRYYSDYLNSLSTILEEQNSSCKICGFKFTRNMVRNQHGTFEARSHDVDHDKKSGRVRGLLCRPCNLLLGNAKENPEILRNAYRYLTTPSGERGSSTSGAMGSSRFYNPNTDLFIQLQLAQSS
jgi:recombination endonuclease VII